MTQIIIDEQTSQTPIGELLQDQTDDTIELRSGSGALLGTLILPSRSAAEREAELMAKMEADVDLINERLARPASEGLSTQEFLDRLRQLET